MSSIIPTAWNLVTQASYETIDITGAKFAGQDWSHLASSILNSRYTMYLIIPLTIGVGASLLYKQTKNNNNETKALKCFLAVLLIWGFKTSWDMKKYASIINMGYTVINAAHKV